MLYLLVKMLQDGHFNLSGLLFLLQAVSEKLRTMCAQVWWGRKICTTFVQANFHTIVAEFARGDKVRTICVQTRMCRQVGENGILSLVFNIISICMSFVYLLSMSFVYLLSVVYILGKGIFWTWATEELLKKLPGSTT